MSLRGKTKKKKYGVFLFPEERTVGSTTTTKITAGKVQEGEVVKLQWDKDEVPAKILRLTDDASDLVTMEREEASRLSSPSSSPSSVPTSHTAPTTCLTTPTPSPGFHTIDDEVVDEEEDEALAKKIKELVKDIPSPALLTACPSSPNPVPNTFSQASNTGFITSDSSKLTALITNTFQNNQMLQEIMTLLQHVLFKLGSQLPTPTPPLFSSLPTSLSLPTTLPHPTAMPNIISNDHCLSNFPSALSTFLPPSMPSIMPTTPLPNIAPTTTPINVLPRNLLTDLQSCAPTTFTSNNQDSVPSTSFSTRVQTNQPSVSPTSPTSPTPAANSDALTSGDLSPTEIMRLAEKSKTMTKFSCNIMRALFSKEELKGKSVYGSQKKNPLDRARVEQIKHCLTIVYGEAQITDKVWGECVSSMNAHLRKYQKDTL